MRVLVTIACAAALLAGCGGSDKDRQGATVKPPQTEAERVIRAWADGVRTGDWAKARKTFGLPAVVANGGGKLRLKRPVDVDQFNRAFPCGAIVQGVDEQEDGRVLATFTLTDGAEGRQCGAGKGQPAKVVFRIRDGKIVEWLRDLGEQTSPNAREA